MKLKNQRDFVLSVDECNRVASFITILAQVNQRVRTCKKDKARKKDKKVNNNKSKTPLIELGSHYREPFLFIDLENFDFVKAYSFSFLYRMI